MGSRRIVVAAALLAGWLLSAVLGLTAAADPFQAVWARTDDPVAQLQVSRSWLWGPGPFTAIVSEPYAESPGGMRDVRYYDKGRMEITDPAASTDSEWFATSGLLATEMVTGQLQVGADTFVERAPATINVAGDPDGASSPNYATFTDLINAPPLADGVTVTSRIDRAGTIVNDPSLARYGVTASHHVVRPGIDHQVASVFWDFMNNRGLVEQGGQLVEDQLFPTPVYATGDPITEPYWTTVEVSGKPTTVLVQIFERRVLTYTPDNLDGWKVETGNDGQHYYLWRYGTLPQWNDIVSDIVFVSARPSDAGGDIDEDLFLVHADGSRLERLTDTSGADFSPDWSPDGQQIAYIHNDPDINRSRVFAVDADGGNPRPLTEGLTWPAYPTWSPDGTRIAYVSINGGTEPHGLYLIRIDGSSVTQQLLTPNEMEVFRYPPSWSPDGTRIVFSGSVAPDYSAGVFVINADGSGLARISNGGAPILSPDGERVAYEDNGLWIMNADGSNQHLLGYFSSDEIPSWSPDNTHLVSSWAPETGASQIVVIDAETGAFQPVTPSRPDMTMGDRMPHWSPDGLQIIFIRYTDQGDMTLVVVNVDGSREWPIPSVPGYSDGSPDWRPTR